MLKAQETLDGEIMVDNFVGGECIEKTAIGSDRTKTKYKLGSLFDGSGGFPLAATICGGEPVWAAEIEPYPIAVTTSRFPHMKHIGSVTDINGAEIEPVDVITFGSPCQDLSIAGKRAGLKHESNGDELTTRSGLFMEAVRIIREMREATNGRYPTFALWENVPGAFSSNKGEDFRVVLQELIQIVEPGAVMPPVPKNGWAYADHYCGDGWSLAYRVLDAQFWGVPQRRRRVFLTLDLTGNRARAVCFEREGLRGHFETFRTAWEAPAGDAVCGIETADCEAVPYTLKIRPGVEVDSAGKSAGKGALIQTDMSATLAAAQNQYLFQPVIAVATQQGGAEITTNGICPTVTAAAGMSGNNQPWICMESAGFKANQGPKAGNIGWESERACTLNADRPGLEPTVCAQYLFENHSQDSRYKDPLDVCPMLPAQLGTGGNNQPFVVHQEVFRKGTRPHSAEEAQKWEDADVANTLNTFDQGETRASESVVEEVIPINDKATRWKGGGSTRNHDGSGNGMGVGQPGDPFPTLTAGDRHAVCYTNTYQNVTGPLMANSHPGSYTGQDAYTDMLVVGEQPVPIVFDKEVYQSGEHATGGHYISEGGPAPTLRATGHPPGICYGEDCRNLTEHAELYPTLQAKPNGGQSLNDSSAVRIEYIVRRLTPTECARLQGFYDNWGIPDPKEDFTDEEYKFWLNVRNTHAVINGKTVCDYTKEQMVKWYGKLHTDSSEYKMWGNGIALPCAVYIMQGIAAALEKDVE